jgi:hypothetical protein
MDWYNGLARLSHDRSRKGVQFLIMIVCWAIGCERNARIFEGKEKQTSRLVTEIKEMALLWSKASARNLASIVGYSGRE